MPAVQGAFHIQPHSLQCRFGILVLPEMRAPDPKFGLCPHNGPRSNRRAGPSLYDRWNETWTVTSIASSYEVMADRAIELSIARLGAIGKNKILFSLIAG